MHALCPACGSWRVRLILAPQIGMTRKLGRFTRSGKSMCCDDCSYIGSTSTFEDTARMETDT